MGRLEKTRKFLRDNFLSGLLVVVPLAASIYVLVNGSLWLYHKITFLPINYDRVGELLAEVMPKYMVGWIVGSIHLIEFFAVLVVLFFLTALAGLITKIRLGNWFFGLSERVLEKIPLVGMVYSSVKQLLQAVFSGKGNFSRVVMLEYPRKGIWSLGFVSRGADSSFSKAAGKKLMSVFIPTTPNPTSGYLLMVPKEDLIDLDLSIEQAFKIIISAGMVLAHEEPDLGPAGDTLMDKFKEMAAKQSGGESEESGGSNKSEE